MPPVRTNSHINPLHAVIQLLPMLDEFLQRQSGYPFICYYAAQVLAAYLTIHYPQLDTVSVIAGEYCTKSGKKFDYHEWIVVSDDSIIIDPTHKQFYPRENRIDTIIMQHNAYYNCYNWKIQRNLYPYFLKVAERYEYFEEYLDNIQMPAHAYAQKIKHEAIFPNKKYESSLKRSSSE